MDSGLEDGIEWTVKWNGMDSGLEDGMDYEMEWWI